MLPPAPAPDHALFGCLEGDSAVYAEAPAAASPGVTIDLWQAGDGIDGATRPTGASPERSAPLAGIRLIGRDSVRLEMPRGPSSPDTSVFVGRVSCDSLWGRGRDRRAASERAMSYRRVRDAAVDGGR